MPVARVEKHRKRRKLKSGGDKKLAPLDEHGKNFLQENAVIIECNGQDALNPLVKFSDLPVRSEILKFLERYQQPTPIQAVSWPYLLRKDDFVGISETGSGKTLCFGIPLVNKLKSHKSGIRGLILSPTRELALQNFSILDQLGKRCKIKSVCVYGGFDKQSQIRKIRESNIVVGTPGRILDLINQSHLDLKKVSFVVLDEADRMLDKGFEQDIIQIISCCKPKAKRRTVYFSATWPQSVRELAASLMRNFVRVTIGSEDLNANKNIEQVVQVINDPALKVGKLLSLLQGSDDKVLIFALYKKEAAHLEGLIARKGFSVVGLHGDMSQQARTISLDKFKSGEKNILVATDVAARGLDIPKVKLVVNFTFPLTIEDYIHRIGRTGRAKQSGKAITFFTAQEKALAGALVNVLRNSNQNIPDDLLNFGTAVKPKLNAYGERLSNNINVKPSKLIFD